MAKIISDEKEIAIEDGMPIKQACKKLEVPFSCEDGLCGTCLIKIKEGMKNLTDITEQEKNMGIENKEQGYRLACQCKIKKGVVIIEV